MPTLTKERGLFTLQTAFRAHRKAQGRTLHRLSMTDIICCLLWLLAIVEIIWAAGQVGDLVVLALQLAGTGWV